MASSGPWADFEVHKNNIRYNTVAKLQTIISGWTEQCRTSIPKSGKKQDLIDRMTRVMNEWKENNQHDKWLRAKAVIEQVRETGQYSHYAMPAESTGGPLPHPPFAPASSQKLNGHVPYPPPAAAGPSHLRYDAYAPPRKAAAPTAPNPSSPTKPSIRFKSSPFYRVDQLVSPVVECPESTSAMDRRSQSLSFTLTSDHLSRLQQANSMYQLRLFCTSSIYHVHHHTGFRTEAPCPMEFPATCEVRVNNIQLSANLKGLKKKPGTAPPPDLGKAVRLNSQMQNRVDMVYVNSQQPVQHKKFYMVVCLVETTTVEQLVEKLKKGKYKSETDIRAKMVQTNSFDDDIVAGPQKMSLKCPLSYIRVNTPCRSIQCPHAQCFDATSWFSMMEQTTTWLCPVCDKVLNIEELIIDGYFDRILKDTPESVEDVMVEADGEWHTSDNKSPQAALSRKEPEKPAASASTSTSSDTLKARVPQEVISLTDSEDDEEGIVKRELSPNGSYTTSQSQSFGSGHNLPVRQPPPPPQTSKASSSAEIIDLTLDSDEEEPAAAPPQTSPKITLKRKERDLNSLIEPSAAWKKQRLGGPSGSESASRSGSGSGAFGDYSGTVGGSSSANGTGVNGASQGGYGGAGSSGANGWGPVRIQPSAPPQSAYQAPYSPTAPLSPGTSVSQGMNANYAPSVSHSVDVAMPRPPTPATMALYYRKLFGHTPGHHA